MRGGRLTQKAVYTVVVADQAAESWISGGHQRVVGGREEAGKLSTDDAHHHFQHTAENPELVAGKRAEAEFGLGLNSTVAYSTISEQPRLLDIGRKVDVVESHSRASAAWFLFRDYR